MAREAAQEAPDEARDAVAGSAQASSSCQVCSKAAHKYRCPGCGISSCSLSCSREHKAASGCTGKKDPTDFCTLRDFTDSRLLSDYFLLEKVSGAKQAARKVISHQAAASAQQTDSQRSPAVLRQLMDQAKRRGVKLRMQPPGMTKSRCNTSCWDSSTGTLLWRVHWRFPAADNTCIQDRAIPENAVIKDVLESHLRLQPGQAQLHHLLRHHAEAGCVSLTVLMREASCPASAVKWHEVSLDGDLRQFLPGKTIIEFPELVVLLPREVHEFHIIQPCPLPAFSQSQVSESAGPVRLESALAEAQHAELL